MGMCIIGREKIGISGTKDIGISRVALRTVMSWLPLSSLMAILVITGCKDNKVETPKPHTGTVIARVGNSVLTLEEFQASIPNEYSDVITYEQNIQYVKQWINTELLYREALRLKVDHEPEIKVRLEKMKKDLLSSEIISRGTSQSVAETVSEQAVKEYYEANRDGFIRESYVIRYDDIIVEDINVAWEIRNTVTHETFKEVANAHSKVPTSSLDHGTPYVPIDIIPPVIRNAAQGAKIPSITGPYRADDGFHIMRLVGKYEKGTIASLDEVHDDIVTRLSNKMQKNEIERLISEVRSRADVEFHENLVPGAGAPEKTAPAAAGATESTSR